MQKVAAWKLSDGRLTESKDEAVAEDLAPKLLALMPESKTVTIEQAMKVLACNYKQVKRLIELAEEV